MLQQLQSKAGLNIRTALARFVAASFGARRLAEAAGGTASAAAGKELSLRQVARLARKASAIE